MRCLVHFTTNCNIFSQRKTSSSWSFWLLKMSELTLSQAMQMRFLLFRATKMTQMTSVPAPNTEKICKLCKAIFSAHYNIFQPNFGILLLLKGSFREFRFFVWICLDQELVYIGKRIFEYIQL